MKKLIKRYFPAIVRLSRPIRLLINKVVSDLRLKYYLNSRDKLHTKRLSIIRKKLAENKKINIAFIVFDPSIWKYERLYRLLELDGRFIPTIVFAVANFQDSKESLTKNQAFFSRTYNTLGGFDSATYNHKDFHKKLHPDIVVTSAPYNYFHKNFNIYKMTKYLTIYAQYGINLHYIKSVFINDHNNLLWRCYVESDYHLHLYNSWLKELGLSNYNLRSCGYPGADDIKQIIYDTDSLPIKKRKLVIWAPHWSIDKSSKFISIGTFLDYYLIMVDIAKDYSEDIDFVLKPHPLLTKWLSKKEFLGGDLTNEYFDKWKFGVNTKLKEDNYIELFNQSDAIIHDSGTFIVEYLYTMKPAAYLTNNEFDLSFFNYYGKEALKSYQIIKNKNEITYFLDNLLAGIDPKLEQRRGFFNKYLRDHHNASECIYRDVLDSIITDS